MLNTIVNFYSVIFFTIFFLQNLQDNDRGAQHRTIDLLPNFRDTRFFLVLLSISSQLISNSQVEEIIAKCLSERQNNNTVIVKV